MSLCGLPNDLLFDIFHLLSVKTVEYTPWITESFGKKDIISLMLCCQRMHHLGRPILHSIIKQTSDTTLLKLIHTIIKRPELLRHVRQLLLQEPTHNRAIRAGRSKRKVLDLSLEGLFLGTEVEESSLWKVVAWRYDGPCPEKAWYSIKSVIKDVIKGQWRAMAAFLLICCPNFEILQLTNCSKPIGNGGGLDYLSAVIADVAVSTQLSKRLVHISVAYATRGHEDGLRNLIPILEYSSLVSIECDMIRVNGTGFGLAHKSKPRVSDLQFNRSNISPTSLKELLSSFPSLKILKYEHDEDGEANSFHDSPFFPQVFGASIWHLRKSIVSLVLYRREKGGHSRHRRPLDEEFLTIGSLFAYEKLKCLAITANLLLGIQKSEGSMWYTHAKHEYFEQQFLPTLLPPSLERLYLKNCGDAIFEQVSGLVVTKEFVTPKLREIVLQFVDFRHDSQTGGFSHKSWRGQPSHRGVSQKRADELVGECAAKGIELDILYD